MNASHSINSFTNHATIFTSMAKLLHTPIKTNNSHNFSIHSDEGVALETSAFQIFLATGWTRRGQKNVGSPVVAALAAPPVLVWNAVLFFF